MHVYDTVALSLSARSALRAVSDKIGIDHLRRLPASCQRELLSHGAAATGIVGCALVLLASQLSIEIGEPAPAPIAPPIAPPRRIISPPVAPEPIAAHANGQPPAVVPLTRVEPRSSSIPASEADALRRRAIATAEKIDGGARRLIARAHVSSTSWVQFVNGGSLRPDTANRLRNALNMLAPASAA